MLAGLYLRKHFQIVVVDHMDRPLIAVDILELMRRAA
jgi:hypothetical protein